MLKWCRLIRQSWLAGGVCRYNSERGPSKDHSIKVWCQLAKQFQRRFLNIFPIGSYVKLMSVDSAVLVGGRGLRIQFWKGTTQEPFQQSLAPLGRAVSEKIFKHFFAKFSIFSHGGHLGWWTGSSDTILKGDHPRKIPAKFGPSWHSGFRED